MKFSQNLTYYLERAQMSEYTLARLIGVDPDEVIKWEKGSHKPDAGTLHYIACALNISDEALTDPGPLPDKSPAKEEVKHEHVAFDGGVLGQPEGIYGTSDKESKEASASTTTSATASKPVAKPVFASDSENVLWRGSSKHVCDEKVKRNVIIIIIFFLIGFITSMSSGSAAPVIPFIVIGAFILIVVSAKKGAKTIVKEYKLTDSRISIKTNGFDYVIALSDVSGIRIVDEDAEGKGSIIINIIGRPAISVLPTVDSEKPISVMYDVKSVRHVFNLINDAYYADKKRRENKV